MRLCGFAVIAPTPIILWAEAWGHWGFHGMSSLCLALPLLCHTSLLWSPLDPEKGLSPQRGPVLDWPHQIGDGILQLGHGPEAMGTLSVEMWGCRKLFAWQKMGRVGSWRFRWASNLMEEGFTIQRRIYAGISGIKCYSCYTVLIIINQNTHCVLFLL